MTYPVSACVFIRNNQDGAFCLWESMACLLPFVSEYIIMDCGSTDGTLEILKELEQANSKIKLVIRDKFPHNDASVFADLANELIDMCQYDNVLYHQADEIWHEKLLKQMEQRFERGEFDLSFWRVQFKANFQRLKWYPHIVHRVGPKDNFNFVGDGMNSDRYFDGKLVYENYNGGWFSRWGDEFDFDGKAKVGTMKDDTPYKMPIHEMITDISLVGGFLENIAIRKGLHLPFWNEGTNPQIRDIDNDHISYDAPLWMNKQRNNPEWEKRTSHFDLPNILKPMIGVKKYYARPDVLDAIKFDTTRHLLKLWE